MNELLLVLLWSHLAQTSPQENLFYDINKLVENIMNSTFTLLDLNNNFINKPENRLLLSMHKTMKSTAERNYEAYKNVKESSKLSGKEMPKSGNFFIYLHKLTDLIVQEKLTPNNATRNSKQTNKTGINLQLTDLEIPDDREQSLSMLKEYLATTKDGLLGNESPHQKIKREFENNRQKVKFKRNLKVWKASQETNLTTNYTQTRRVFHGRTVKIKKYPFLASVHVMMDFVCAGSIISKNMILTAATCLHVALNNERFLRDNPEGVKIRVGSAYTQRFGDTSRVIQIYFHPEYNTEDLHNNLAILKTEKLHFTNNKKIRRIEYQRWKGLPDNVREVVMLGWGDKDAQVSSEFEPLSFSFLNIFNQKRCMQTYTKKYVTDKNFCAGFTNKGSGACLRDVGGPAIVGSKLVGVVSFGPPVCGTPDAPTVFSSVGYHTAWIDSVVREDMVKRRVRVTSTATTKLPLLTNNYKDKEFKIKQQFQAIHSHVKKSKPSLVPKSERLNAIQILQNLLNRLIQNGSILNDTMHDADDNNNDDIIFNVDEEVDDNDKSLKAATENPLYSQIPRAKLQTKNTLMRASDLMNFNTGELINHVVNGLQVEILKTSIMSGSTDPFFIAIKSLSNYLGLEKLMQAKENYKIVSNKETSSKLLRPSDKTPQIIRSNKINGITKGLKKDSLSQTLDKESSAPNYIFDPTEGASIEDALQVIEKVVQSENESSNESFIQYTGMIGTTRSLNEEFESVGKIGKIEYENAKIQSRNGLIGRQGYHELIGNNETDESYTGYSDADDVSDNYESESEGLSIEVQGNLLTNSLTTANIPFQALTQIDYYDRAQQFLSKNFVKDNNVTLTEIEKNNNSDELVVLLLQTTTKNPKSKVRNKIALANNGKKRQPSRYSVMSNFDNIITLTKFNKTSNKPRNRTDLPANINETFFKNGVPVIARLRSFDDSNNYSDFPLHTTATMSIYSSSTALSAADTVINTKNSTTTEFLTSTSSSHNPPAIKNTTTFIGTNTKNTSIITYPSVIETISTAKTNMSKESTTLVPKEITMAAYDMAEEEAEKEKEDGENTDTENRRRFLDYINIR